MGIYNSSAASEALGVGSRQRLQPSRLSPFGLLNQEFFTSIIHSTLVSGFRSTSAAEAQHV